MDRCVYNDAILYAEDAIEDFELEKTIRNAGRYDLLGCHGCSAPVILKRGEKRKAHFAHKKSNETCEYYEHYKKFSKRLMQTLNIKERLYKHFSNLFQDGYRVTKDEKTVDGHWSDIAIYSIARDKYFAIDIMDKRMTQKDVSDIHDKYAKKDISYDIIIIDRTMVKYSKETEMYYVKRSRLNHHPKGMAFVIDETDEQLVVYKLDPRRYFDADMGYCHEFTDDVFSVRYRIADLRLSATSLYVPGFKDDYQKWLKTRMRLFLETIDDKKKQARIYEGLKLLERNRELTHMREDEAKKSGTIKFGSWTDPPEIIKDKEIIPGTHALELLPKPNVHDNEVIFDEISGEIFNEYRDTDVVIKDKTRLRWYVCIHCGSINSEDGMAIFGGTGSSHKGTCSICGRHMR